MSNSTNSQTNASPRRAMFIAALVSALVLVQLAGAALASGPDGSLEGYVTDEPSGSPVAGAIVRFEARTPLDEVLPWVYELVTDGAGHFLTTAVPGTYNMIVIHPDYSFYMQGSVGVGSSQTTWANASLQPAAARTGTLAGTVYDASTGLPIPFGAGGRIVAVPPTGPGGPSAYVNVSLIDGSGYYEMDLVPGDYQAFTNNIAGYYPDSLAPVTISAGMSTPLDFSLWPNPLDAWVNGTVYDVSTGLPVPGATVSAAVDELFLPPVVADGSGAYSIPAPSGMVTLTANDLGYGPDTETLWVAPMSSNVLDLYVRPILGAVVGYVYDGISGSPVPGALVSAADADGYYDHAFSDASGYYTIPIPSGTFEMVAAAAGYAPGFGGAFASEGETVWMNFTLLAISATVQGYLVDAAGGSPIPGLMVWAFDPFSGYSAFNFSDAGGFYSMPTVATPLLYLVVPSQGIYAGGSGTVSVPSGEVAWLNVTVYPIEAVLRVTVTDILTGLPIPGASVSLSWGMGYSDLNVTDPSGTADLDSPAAPDVFVSVWAMGYLSFATTLEPASGLNWLNVSLWPDLPLDVLVRGYITDFDTASPIAGSAIEVTGYDDQTYLGWTDGSGYYEVWVVAYPQTVRATAPAYASNETAIAPSSGETLWANMTLESDPVPPVFVDFSAAPSSSVSPTNPTTLAATISEKSLATADLSLLRLKSVAGSTGTFQIVGDLDPADVAIVETAPDMWEVTSTWDSRTSGGWVMNGTGSEWWPAMTGFPGAWAVFGRWDNGSIPMPDDSVAIFDEATGVLLLLMSFTYGFIDPASQPTSIFTPAGPGILVNLTTEYIEGWSWVMGSNYSLGDLGFAFDDRVPTDTYAAYIEAYDAGGNFNANATLFTVDNTPPSADAGGPYTVDAGHSVTFDGSGSADNVAVVNYTWTFDDGGPRTLYGAGPSYTFASPGTYLVTLTVRDAAGNEGADTVVVTVNPDTTDPTADAGPDQIVDEDAPVTFDGSGSTDDVAVVNYTWTFTDGVARTLYGVSPSYTFATPGSYSVTLTVRDAAGNSDPDTLAVTVRDVTDPTANAGSDQTVDEDTVVTFSGAASTDNVGIAGYTWTFTDGTPQTLSGVSPTYTFATPGTYVVTLTVTDAAGNSATDTLTVTVADVTDPTVSIASPGAGGIVSGTVEVTVTAADNVGIVRVELYVDGALVATDTSSPFELSFNAANYSNGAHTIRVVGYDAAGNSASVERSVTLSNAAPSGLGFAEYGLIGLAIAAVAALAAWLLVRRKRPPATGTRPPEGSPEPPATDESLEKL